jgi:uncharacterized protein (UPF0332 family)
VTDEVDRLLFRSGRDLDAAAALTREGFHEAAISRAYYSAFYAAEAALLVLGESRSKHSGVLSAFARLIVLEGGLDPEIGRLLRSLFERRNQADYEAVEASYEEARAAVADAGRVIEEVSGWVGRRRE